MSTSNKKDPAVVQEVISPVDTYVPNNVIPIILHPKFFENAKKTNKVVNIELAKVYDLNEYRAKKLKQKKV